MEKEKRTAKKFLSPALALILTLALYAGLFPLSNASASTAHTAELQTVTIKIPGSDAIFTLENVSAEYVLTTSSDGLPLYRFAFPGDYGKVTCDQSADVDAVYSWLDVNPQNSGGGGGEQTMPAGWSVGYPSDWIGADGEGLVDMFLTIRDDGTLIGWEKPAVALVEFNFGYPITSVQGNQFPDDLISYEWRERLFAAPEMIHIDLPKRPVSELAVISAPIPLTVNPTASTVYIDGKATEFEAYLINDNNYFMLRDLAMAINGTDKQFNVGFNEATSAVTITSETAYAPRGNELATGDGTPKTAILNTTMNFLFDGEPVEITAYLIEGSNFVRLRDVMRLADVFVGWDGATSTITLDTSMGYVD